MRYIVEGPSDSVLRDAIVSLVRELRPGAVVSCRESDALRIHEALCGNWLAISPAMNVVSAGLALADGAVGCVALDGPMSYFRDGLNALDRGGSSSLPRNIILQLARHVGGGPNSAGGPARLSVRQTEVLAGIAEGLSNREIADDLGISENTVRAHLNTLATKLDAPASRGKIVAKARVLGIDFSAAGLGRTRRAAAAVVTTSGANALAASSQP